MESPAIEIKNLTVEYQTGLFRKPGRGVNNLTFSVERGILFGFLGPNGAGKTTTMKVLTGLLPPTSGEVLIIGRDITDPETRSRIGFMPEKPYFYEYLTAMETLGFYGALFNMDQTEIRKRGGELLEKAGLKEVDDVRVGEYSKGMRQRLGFAQALLNDPAVIFLDEPLSGLDPIGRSDMKNIMREEREKGKTVFYSSHILSDVEDTCDEVALLNKGHLLKKGPIAEILSTGDAGVDITFKYTGDSDHQAWEDLKPEELTKDMYRVHIRDRNESASVISSLSQMGMEIQSVLPSKRDLETFFVEVIREQEPQKEEQA